MHSQERRDTVIDVNGAQVFTADFVFEQLQAQGRRIDRARGIALVAVVVALCSLAICATMIVH